MIEVIVAVIGVIGLIGVALINNRRRYRDGGAEIPKLVYHSVFKVMDTLIIKSDTFHVNDFGKQKALRYVLKNALIIVKDEMYQLADKIDGCERTSCSMDQKTSHMINQNSDAINNSLKRIGAIGHQGNLSESDREVLTVVMEKLLCRIEDKIETLRSTVKDFAVVEAISDCKTKQYFAFSVWGAVMSTMYIDLQVVSDDINGDLNGMVFQNELIGY